jgi:Galactose oxidase, central domain
MSVSSSTRPAGRRVSERSRRHDGATAVKGMPMRNLQKVRRRASRFGSLALAVAVLSLSGCTSGGVTAPTGAPAAATSTPTPSTHVYTGIFTPTADLAAARWGHTATLLPNGRVLITGGADLTGGFDTSSNNLASAELYDPASGTFTPTASLAAARASHTATRLSDGRVLITGGYDSRSSALASAELYDPASGTFTPTADLAAAR